MTEKIEHMVNIYDIYQMHQHYAKFPNTEALRAARRHAKKTKNLQRFISLGVVLDLIKIEEMKQC